MKLVFKKIYDSPANLLRRQGYAFSRRDDATGEMSFVKRVNSGDYPRFHIYTKINSAGEVEVSLHLDQKKASYRGSAAHGGEYEGEILDREIELIKKVFSA